MILLYDSLYRRKRQFIPIDINNVKVYFCGPTVYNDIHCGNLRPLIVGDCLVRVLRTKFTKVTYVRNLTDIEDKIIQRAQMEKISVHDLTTREITKFHEICRIFKFLPLDAEPKATDHLEEIVHYITKIIDNGGAYQLDDGIYCDTSKDLSYGRFSNISMNLSGARVEENPHKKSPQDFVLWKKTDISEGYSSKFGPGRPGWHIECAAMIKKNLGDIIDIHGGGNDLEFPHHENEITESILGYGSILSNYWLHNGMVNMNSEKMSKSLGNVLLVKDIVKTEKDAAAMKYLFLSTHYRQPLSFSLEAFQQSLNAVILIRIFVELNKKYYSNDFNCIDENFYDDLNTPMIFFKLHEAMTKFHTIPNSKDYMDVVKNSEILGILYQPEILLSEDIVNDLLKQRDNHRVNKEYTKADEIKNKLQTNNIRLFDQKNGNTQWIYI